MTVVALSAEYACKMGGPVLRQVDTDIFRLRYFMNCMGCGFCNDICCSHGVDVDLENVARLKAAPQSLKDFIGVPESEWFTEEVTKDAEFPSGAHVRTQVKDGRCVFLNRQARGCKVHSWCLDNGVDYHTLKPMVSVLFPVTFDYGVLHASNEVVDGSLACYDTGPTCYEGSRDELLYYFGPGLVAELDALRGISRLIDLPTYEDVKAAAARIKRHAVRTPLVESPLLSELAGTRVFLKLEIFQRTGSFKFRGALNRMALIPQSDWAGGVVAFSSGNHAQGVAAVARQFGMPAVIVMPSDAPRPKIDGTRALGAEVVLYDRLREDREAIAARIQGERGATLIRPFDDPAIIAGQGTVGLEIAEDAARLGVALETVLVPCSGGGLVTGVALGLNGTARVHSVEPENYDGMRRSLAAGARVTAPGGALSIADALMAPTPGVHVFELAKGLLGEGLTVTDAELEQAVAFAATRLKLLVEPGGAAALAALLAGKAPRGVNIALVLSGGNAEFGAIADIVARWSTP